MWDLRPALLRLGGLLVVATGCAAGATLDTHTTFAVGVRVLARTTLRVRSGPSDILISPENTRNGYVEVTEPTVIEVSNTSPQGYALVITPQSALLSSFAVQGAGGEVMFGNDGGMIVERGQTGSSMALELTYHFVLASGIAPGRYPWPLQLAVQPLGAP